MCGNNKELHTSPPVSTEAPDASTLYTEVSRRGFVNMAVATGAVTALAADPLPAFAAANAKIAVPSGSAIQAAVNVAHGRASTVQGGANADYIPFLANIPSHLCGVAVVTAAGDIYSAGDADYGFAIESISKVFTMAQVMEEIGPDEVRKKVGVDPTGLPFNSVFALELNKGMPLSPLVNAGAISTVSLVKGSSAEDIWNKILAFQSRMAGSQIKINEELNRSEQDTNSHNKAIAWLMESAGTMYGDPLIALDIYTRQCSTLVSCKQLAMMGATLANHGRNPKTGEQVVNPQNIRHILAQMMMEGLYTYSGDFAYTVGLPGKSGVGGGVLAVAPGRLAIAGFSPPVDGEGNSVRGVAAVTDVANQLNLNIFAT